MNLRGGISNMEWSQARAAIADRARDSDELQLLWEALHETKRSDSARKLISNAAETTAAMLVMLDEWVDTAADGEPDDETEEDPT